MAIYDANGNLLLEGTEIEPYYASEIDDTVAKVRALQTEPNLTFFVVTDIHAYYVADAMELYKMTVANMMKLAEEIPCDGIINLGDTIEGYTTKGIAQEYGNAVCNEFRKAGIPYYGIIGNHDDNREHSSSTDERLTVGERYQLFSNPTRRVVSDTTGLNFYVDFPEFKIRMLCLNSVASYSYRYDADTCAWIASTGLELPTGYKVLMCTHVAPVGAWNYGTRTPANSATVQEALNNVDTMAIICGHNHVDAVFDTPFRGITLNCEKFENTNGNPDLWPAGAVKPQRTLGDYTEDCWTVCVIRPISQKINFIRFGAGDDYEIDYGSAGST